MSKILAVQFSYILYHANIIQQFRQYTAKLYHCHNAEESHHMTASQIIKSMHFLFNFSKTSYHHKRTENSHLIVIDI
jgi:hypothetical protein